MIFYFYLVSPSNVISLNRPVCFNADPVAGLEVHQGRMCQTGSARCSC